MNTPDTLSSLPPILQAEVIQSWQDYQANIQPEDETLFTQHPEIFDSIPKVWGCSKFVAQNCVQNPAILRDLIASGDLLNPSIPYAQRLAEQLSDVKDEEAVMRTLRLYRRREMLRIAWRDLAGFAPLEESLKSLSDLADAMIDTALTWVYQRLITKYGTPCNAQGVPQQLVVLGLGKLGGQELNFSSDIDPIFCYPQEGETQGTKRTRTNHEFFQRLGQQLINVLNNITADGFVFRVDMRLRPFGDAGPLVVSFAAMEEYYEAHARDWERYALVKARVVAGDKTAGDRLLKNLRPFVYRRYLDFNAFEALRNMKALIDQETSRKGLNNNIKLGPGGIREIEFVCQVFQLIRGGRQPALQQRHLLTTLEQLEKYQIVPPEVTSRLREAYRFLRLTENHLQAIEDRQTQTLPDDDLNQARLAYSMDFSDWSHFIARLLFHHQQVHSEFEQVIAPQPTLSKPVESLQSIESQRWKTLWMGGLENHEQAESLLKSAGFWNGTEVLTHLRQLLESRSVTKLTRRGREKLDTVIPLLLTAALEQQSPDDAIHRSLKFTEAVAQRSVYLTLLLERPVVLKQLVRLCAESAWIAEQLTRYPILLDELIDPRRLYDPLKPAELDNALQAQLAHFAIEDLDIQMDSLRQFKRAQVLHIAAAELSGNLTVEVASDYLAAIADTLVRRSLTMACDYLYIKHGQPRYLYEGEKQTAGMCVIAYGKAGGIELSYGSDLDLVFLHDSCGEQQLTDGNKQLDNQVFFARLAQRIIHIITTNTPAGILYEVDSRLRPDGESGMLVSSLEAFGTYQQEKAWTWEHQALVRARPIAGSPHNIKRFEKIRRDTLSIRREPGKLKQEVCEMRDKMRDNLDKSKPSQPPFDEGTFDLKQGRGGIADIEFIIQYGVLCWSAECPDLLETTGMLPLLQLFAKYELLEESACTQLSKAYRTYRAETHRLALQNKPALVDNKKFAEQRQQVMHWWEKILLS
jgi:[glutamine synthetase] adenylyltransferase / [glutamine synthetase]-adenylyl-L-tyrosine phosphorylase